MGVITCAGCGAKANDEWERCPECGADPKLGFTEEQRTAAAVEQASVLDPVSYARRAREAGLAFLEVALPLSADADRSRRFPFPSAGALDAQTWRAGMLSAIEAEGWELVGSSYLLDDLMYEQQVRLLNPYEHGWLEGKPVGVYLFRAAALS
jgi:hypothetical protein